MTSIFSLRRTFALVVAVVLAASLSAPSAAAQTRAEMNDKIEALEKQLRAVQRRVFDQDSPYFQNDGEPAAPAQPGASSAPARSANPALLADLTVRIERLTSELGRVTGQLEELRHENRQLKERLSRFENDVSLRLERLERGGLAAAGEGSDAVRTPGLADPVLPGASGNESGAADADTDSGESAVTLPEGSPQEQYDFAMSLLRRERMEQAEQAFSAFLDRHAEHALAANAQYWLGETFYRRQQFPLAARAFLNAYQDYPDSRKAPDSVLKLGMTLAALEETDEACAAFDTLESEFPEAEDRILRQMASERRRLGCN